MDKKILTEWCNEFNVPYEAAKKARLRVNVGERKYGYIWLTKKEFEQIKNNLREFKK